MEKQKVIQAFRKGHSLFTSLLEKLTLEQIETVPVAGVWKTKDVIAHLAAWNWEQAAEIDRILQNTPSWNKPETLAYDDDAFNHAQVEKRKHVNTQELIQELEDSLGALVNRIENLSREEWNHRCEDEYWNDGIQVGVMSLFPYEQEGTSDEYRHAVEIKEHFGL